MLERCFGRRIPTLIGVRIKNKSCGWIYLSKVFAELDRIGSDIQTFQGIQEFWIAQVRSFFGKYKALASHLLRLYLS